MGCPNCAAQLAELGPGWWAAFFIIGLFGLLGGFMVFATRKGIGSVTDEEHLEIKYAILDCEDDDWAGPAKRRDERSAE